jgi:multidrug efflux pump subunit AcrB
MSHLSTEHRGIAGTLAAKFIDSRLTPLLIIASVLLGIFATLKLPREEEPQIKVPMVDVLVSMPGASSREIEEQITNPMERLLWEIPGVEYIYSTSSAGRSFIIVRYEVGTDEEEALMRLIHKLQANYDRIPPGVTHPLVKPRGIDDVPILALTLHSKTSDEITLRRLAAEVEHVINRVPQVAETTIIGGERRVARVDLDPARLAARNLSVAGILPMLAQANKERRAGEIVSPGKVLLIESGGFLHSIDEVGDIVLGAFEGRPVYLRDVATITDGAQDPEHYVMYGERGETGFEPAATITVAKRPGANAITVADEVLKRVDALKGHLVPDDVEVSVTRHYGKTAEEKSDELLLHMGIAVFSVALLILFSLGKRESLIVALAIPSTLALTLLTFYLVGYTLNRITLFALIFSIGILVDDAIVVVENITRHMRLPESHRKPISQVAVEAVAEVGNPTVLATWAVIAAIVPMAFVGGMMGPYMRPIPVGASAAMIFSLLIAFIVTPWASIRLIKRPAAGEAGHEGEKEGFVIRLYRRFMHAVLESAWRRTAFLTVVIVLFAAACALVPLGVVRVKMLPFDNKSEFQVIINMPEGTPLECTARVAQEMAERLRQEPEVSDVQVYAGTAAPFNFNGLVRHYFMRRGHNVADVQVNLLPKHDRKAASHDIARRVRPALREIADRYDARIAVAEVPPGPPVLETLVAEVYGESRADREALARRVKKLFDETRDVVDIDYYWESDQTRWRLVIDKEKAALNGITAATISDTLKAAVGGVGVDLVHIPGEKEPVFVMVRLDRTDRTDPRELLDLRVRAGDANMLPEPGIDAAPPLVPLGELVTLEKEIIDKSIYHKNLMPVTYVIADVAGKTESPGYVIMDLNRKLEEMDVSQYGVRSGKIKIHNLTLPELDIEPSIKWDGEWHITLEVFRDLGIAFAVCLVLIYMLMVGWFQSFVTPLVVMVAIPFSLIGILPAHGAMDAFFTATSMIGFMAGAGIVVRNSIILVDFTQLRLNQGTPLLDAVVDAGAVRYRPMMLTAMAVVIGAAVILTDPIFQGLAISLMAGGIAALFVSLPTVPVLYYIVNRRKYEKLEHAEAETEIHNEEKTES